MQAGQNGGCGVLEERWRISLQSGGVGEVRTRIGQSGRPEFALGNGPWLFADRAIGGLNGFADFVTDPEQGKLVLRLHRKKNPNGGLLVTDREDYERMPRPRLNAGKITLCVRKDGRGFECNSSGKISVCRFQER